MAQGISSIGALYPTYRRRPISNLVLIRNAILFAYLFVNFTAVSLQFSSISGADPDLAEGSLFWQILVPSFFCIALLLNILSRTGFRRIASVAIPLAPVLIWVLLSVIWSQFPEITLKRAVRITLEASTAVLLAAAYRDQYKLLRVTCFTFCFITAIDIALLAFPDISFLPDGYKGFHYHKNDAGVFFLTALPIFLLGVFDRRIFYSRLVSAAFVICCSAFLVLSQSKTSAPLTPVCLAITIMLVIARLYSADYTSAVVFMMTCVIAVSIMFVAMIGLDNFLSYFVEDLTFSGRTAIWDYTMSRFWENPIFGQGFGAIWNVGLYSLIQQKLLNIGLVLKHAHNGYIGVLAEIGVVGLSLLIGFLFVTLFRLWVRIPIKRVNRVCFIAIYLLLANCLVNITEVTFLTLSSNLWIYFLLMSAATISIAPLSRSYKVKSPRRIPLNRPG
jgi:exopolysaccharide production protein ExoQ